MALDAPRARAAAATVAVVVPHVCVAKDGGERTDPGCDARALEFGELIAETLKRRFDPGEVAVEVVLSQTPRRVRDNNRAAACPRAWRGGGDCTAFWDEGLLPLVARAARAAALWVLEVHTFAQPGGFTPDGPFVLLTFARQRGGEPLEVAAWQAARVVWRGEKPVTLRAGEQNAIGSFLRARGGGRPPVPHALVEFRQDVRADEVEAWAGALADRLAPQLRPVP